MSSGFQALSVTGLGIALCATGLSLGMRHTLTEAFAPLRRGPPVPRLMVLNAIVVPLAVFGVTRALGASAYAAGILLVTLAMAAPGGLKLTQIARGNTAIAISLIAILRVLSVATIPAWSLLLLPGGPARALSMAATLTLVIVLPLGVGMAIRRRYPAQAEAWHSEFGRIGGLTLVFSAGFLAVLDWQAVRSLLVSPAIVASLIVFPVGMLLGAVLGGDGPTSRGAAMVTTARGLAPALLVALTSFDASAPVIAGVIVAGVATTGGALLAALELGRHVTMHALAGRGKGGLRVIDGALR